MSTARRHSCKIPALFCLAILAWDLDLYGLGSMNKDLLTFVVLPDRRGFALNGAKHGSAGFLPAAHQGTMIRASSANPIYDLFPPKSASYITPKSETDTLDVLNQLNRKHLESHTGDSQLEARIAL